MNKENLTKEINASLDISVQDFLEKLFVQISSSEDLHKAMLNTFTHLASYLPISGISLHRFMPKEDSIQLDFLLCKNNFHRLNTKIELSRAESDELKRHEQHYQLEYGDSWINGSVAYTLNTVLSPYIEPINRTFLVTLIQSNKRILGHLCLIGNAPHCFLPKHEILLEALQNSIDKIGQRLLKHPELLQIKLERSNDKNERSEYNILNDITIIGRNNSLKETVAIIEKIAKSDAPVLIMGETGTGKELIADEIQKLSQKSRGPYVKINCGAIPESLIDSELFGYQKGAFTGAIMDRLGKFEVANGGTLFLDEIGELSPLSQVRLLRVLQDNVIQRVGGTIPIRVDVRIIAATNRSLEKMIAEGSFRQDLYHRLNVFPVFLPPLRARIKDMPLLIDYFIKTLKYKQAGRQKIQIMQENMHILEEYTWPGNVRELRNIIERAITLSESHQVDLSEYLPYTAFNPQNSFFEEIIKKEERSQQGIPINNAPIEPYAQSHEKNARTNFDENNSSSHDTSAPLALDEAMAFHIKKVLKMCNYKISGANGAAEILQINPSTLRKRMKKLNINLEYIV